MDEVLILMHRDSHFSGSFSAMLEYYRNDGLGAIDDIEPEDILHLQLLENQGAILTLGPEEREKVLAAKEAYKKIQNLSLREETSLFADLILSEEEPDFSLFQEKDIPWLIELLHDAAFTDKLFPGYGMAPERAVQVLRRFNQDPRVIQALFARLMHIQEEEFFLQEEIIAALVKAQDFLVARLRSRPVTYENETAAMVLASLQPTKELLQLVEEEEKRLHQEGCTHKQLLAYLESLHLN